MPEHRLENSTDIIKPKTVKKKQKEKERKIEQSRWGLQSG